MLLHTLLCLAPSRFPAQSLCWFLSSYVIQLLFSPGALSLGCGHVFDGKDVIGASVIAQSSQGQAAHDVGQISRSIAAVNIEIQANHVQLMPLF